MGDPITAGVVGSAVLPQLGASLAAPTITGALTSGLAASNLMGAGGGLSGATSPFSLGSLLNGIGTNFAAGGDVVKGTLMNAAALAGSGGGGIGGVGSASSAGGSGSFIGSGFEPSISGFGQGVMESLGAANKFMNQNPVTSRLGMEAAGSLMQEPAPIQMPGGMPVSRGQIQPADFMSLLNPQQSQVIRPQSISLLG